MSELKTSAEIVDLSPELVEAQLEISVLKKNLELANLKITALEAATDEAIPASTTEHTFKIGKAKYKLLYPSFILGSTTIKSEEAVNDAELLALIVKDYPSLCEAL